MSSAAPGTSSAVPGPGSASPLGSPRGVQTAPISGVDRRTRFRGRLPVFSGPLADEASRRVRRSSEDGIRALAAQAREDVDSSVEVTTVVTANDGRTLQARLEFFFYAEGAAHPLVDVSTVVLRRADMRPVLLQDVFVDVPRALSAALREASRVAAEEGRPDPAQSLTADPADWSDWQAGAAGMTFAFDDGAAGSRVSAMRELEVPWSVLQPWVDADAYRLLTGEDAAR